MRRGWLGLAAALVLVVAAQGCTDEEIVGSCTDRLQSGDETDVDCGGRCAPCADLLRCSEDGDCRSGSCDAASGRCAVATCEDGLQNGDESDVDCGGLACEGCAGGLACERGADCVSRSCAAGVCATASCDDGRRNGDETDVDCGGACPKCAPGDACASGDDCDSLLCAGGRCGTSSCTDGLANGEETDVDCGGSDCRPCSDGLGCGAGDDCRSGVCGGEGRCVASTCEDGVLNGDETDVDCGRVCDALCAETEGCRSGPDCASGVCDLLTDTCSPPTCDDDVQNAVETDVDCGGGTCGPCAAGARCIVGEDCFDRICGSDGLCREPGCDDEIRNGEETDVDCGGPACAACTVGDGCARGRDCDSQVCDAVTLTCAAPSCTDGVQNGGESDVDCGGPDCDLCGDFRSCETNDDCASGNCSRDVCVPAGCDFFGVSADYVGCASRPAVAPCGDASDAGVGLSLGDDSATSVTIPFSFRFGGSSYSSVWIGSNGVMSFDASLTSFSNVCLASAAATPSNVIYPFWDDLYPPDGGTVAYDTFGTSPNRTFVAQWAINHISTSISPIDVRVALHEGTNEVEVCYVDTDTGSTSYSRGASATSGVRSSGNALEYSCNRSVLDDGLVLTYQPR